MLNRKTKAGVTRTKAYRVYIDRIQYLLELVPDPKKGELHLLQLEPVRKGSISISKKKLTERSIFILENHNNFQIRKPHA